MTLKSHKIAVVIPKYGLVGGAEGFTSELTERIALERRYDVHVFANTWQSNSERITFHKVPVITFPKFLTTVSFAHFAGVEIAKEGFDIIHAHDRIFEADIYTMHGIPHRMWVNDVRKKRMSLFDHGTAWVEERLIRNKRCRKFIAVSNLAKEKFLKQYDIIDPDRVVVIHPGVDTDRLKSLNRQSCRQEIRQQFHISSIDKIILFVSMNFDIKGLDSLMAALSRLKLHYPSEKFKLLVVGKGNEKKYGAMAQNLGIREQVIFAGITRREDLEKIYVASDAFSMLSKFDTFGMATLEAMAASLPVVVSANVGAKDIVKQSINGFVVEERTDIDAISEKIGVLLNREVRIRMGEAAYETAINNSWQSVIRKYELIYDELLERPS